MTTDLRDIFPKTKGLDEKSISALLQAIKRNHKNGQFDYLKFKQSVLTLQNMDMSIEIAYKSAFATASTLGLTKESLIKSANGYKYSVQNERESFAESLLAQKKVKIDGRKDEVIELTRKIESHKLKIKELEREIAIFQSRIDNVDSDVEAARQKIESVKNNFLEVYDVIHKDISNDIDLINNYLK
ncbi:MAG: hypothetical protein HKO66_02600 [Saprospiraceae bacterium]|nr:DUF724 domain-containing protein [Bacteroidia bacterium]NNE13815.1 hypothetical protein [Saprospiraceae bacterium]NNL91103.1 hypothetical protein [Saprospiraceae bacterium]